MTTRILTVATLLLAACYNPNIEAGQQACSVDGKCPEGLACAPNKRCYPVGFNPDCAAKCAGATPVCDKNTLTCVACLDDSTCPIGFVCALAQKVCKPGCGKSHPGCAPDAGACDVDMGLCHGCLDDKACGNATPRCDVPSGVCFECLPANDNCPNGQYCDVHSCKSGCKDAASCPAPDGGAAPACCAHACADLPRDVNNCGQCGKACAQGSLCCGGSCTDAGTDIAHCGGCGKVCSPANASGPTCTAGACGYMACKIGFSDCDKLTANGCEVNTGADVNNCGACGVPCKTPPNGKAVCTMGACAVSGCSMGFADCDLNVVNGCEVNTTIDVKHCAACGNACPNINTGAPACKASLCGVGACNPGFGDCDGIPGNGCEINTTTTPAHCGGCGKACALANAIPGCVGSLCSVASCNAGFGNCDNMAANGCEVNTNTDLNHCGGCGRQCLVPNATPSCKLGACAIGACNAGFADCDMMAGNGCEKNLNSDAMNCGVCGMVCMQGPCTNGKCAASQTFLAAGNFTVPGGVRSVRVLVVGGGGGGANGHQGGGGSGSVAGATLMVNPGDVIAVTVGAAGLGAAVCNGCNTIVGNTPGGLSGFGGLLTSAGGGTPSVVNGPGGSGGSGGGGSCNGGAPGGAGGANGGNGGLCNQPPGIGQGNTFATALGGILTATMSAGAGGAGGNSSHSGGGGGGGVLLNNTGPRGGDGGQAFSGKGGQGHGAGGGGGGYDANTGPNREAGGNGAPGMVYVEW